MKRAISIYPFFIIPAALFFIQWGSKLIIAHSMGEYVNLTATIIMIILGLFGFIKINFDPVYLVYLKDVDTIKIYCGVGLIHKSYAASTQLISASWSSDGYKLNLKFDDGKDWQLSRRSFIGLKGVFDQLKVAE